jgi:hypothetical protein
MRSTIFTVAILFSILPFAIAQTSLPAQPCAYDHYVHQLDQAYPGFKTTADRVLAYTKRADLAKTGAVYTIPVVVHIVYQDEAQNLPDSLIDGVLEVLNADYRRANADTALLRPEFTDVVGDPGIAFELAAVERVATEATFELDLLGNSLPDNVKRTAEGGSDAWDPERYLNIWVCNIEGGSLLGYAYPPADLSNWPEGASAPEPELDGVVIHQEVFRRTGTYTASGLLGLGEITVPVRGRTITHEVGHYLGLRHIWGDGLLSILGLPDCNADDGVADTPNQGLNSQFACDTEQNTCGSGDEGDMPDMFENFMDYAAEDCLNSFTKQQIAIMRGVLENERSGLVAQTSAVANRNELAAAMQLSPNPAGTWVRLTTTLPAAARFDLTLIDALGRPVLQRSRHAATEVVDLDLAQLAAGIYYVRLQTETGQVGLRRLVVAR